MRLRGYPRPQLERAAWTSLDGPWQFAVDADGRSAGPDEVTWTHRIAVPFAPETPASGVGESGFFRACWYRRTFRAPARASGERLVLHFGAVDWAATVWIDGVPAARHEGGYTPFSVDLSPFAGRDGVHEVVVRAEDDPHDLAKPRGKQTWEREPRGIWYPRTSGIWQTVWLETVPATAIAGLRWMPDPTRWEIGLEARVDGPSSAGLRLHVRLACGGRVLADDEYAVVGDQVTRRIALADPGADDARRALLWSPDAPTLIDAELRLLDGDGTVLDAVRSYTALRAIAAHRGRVLLNGRPCRLRLVLDQGYWPASGLTAPDDAALRRDVELARAMGFNGVRKHQKIEDPRYLYWADRLGLLVWAEMPSAQRFSPTAVERLVREWLAVLARDANHPCIVAWVPFNESWGVPSLPDVAAQRHYVQTLYHLTRTLDPTRLVVANDGWESPATDVVGIHDYDEDPQVIAARYRSPAALADALAHVRPGGRAITLDGHDHAGQPVVLTEFGGIACADDPATWGHAHAESGDVLAERYTALLRVVQALPPLAGFCYTQFADTYQEATGLLTADRRPKVPLEVVAAATRWPPPRRPPDVACHAA